MKIEEAMVWWNDARDHERSPNLPQLKVLSIKENNRQFSYLSKSMGACFGGWNRGDREKLAVHMLSLFVQATGKDGVPAAEAHREFMQIHEYRQWHEHATGPFADAYWAWCTPDAEAARSISRGRA